MDDIEVIGASIPVVISDLSQTISDLKQQQLVSIGRALGLSGWAMPDFGLTWSGAESYSPGLGGSV